MTSSTGRFRSTNNAARYATRDRSPDGCPRRRVRALPSRPARPAGSMTVRRPRPGRGAVWAGRPGTRVGNDWSGDGRSSPPDQRCGSRTPPGSTRSPVRRAQQDQPLEISDIDSRRCHRTDRIAGQRGAIENRAQVDPVRGQKCFTRFKVGYRLRFTPFRQFLPSVRFLVMFRFAITQVEFNAPNPTGHQIVERGHDDAHNEPHGAVKQRHKDHCAHAKHDAE